ncbi:MAG TPA: hypothetical protein VGG33_18750 [Polyangia bacterium]
MNRLSAPLLAFVLWAVGCAHDLPGWKVASTDHFRLHTDRPRRSFDSVLERLEDVHAGLASSFFSEVKVPPMEVFLFETGEFEDLLGDKTGGLFVGGGPGSRGILVLPEAFEAEYLERTAAHELAHGFVNATFQNVPIWFNEGFASYCESIKIFDDKVWFGSSNVFAAGSAVRGQLVPVRELFSARAERFHGDLGERHYTTAWAVIHYIWHGEQKSLRGRFDQFGATLAANGKVPDASAKVWQTIFNDVPFSNVDDRLRDHINAVFALPKSSLVGFRMNRPKAPSIKLTPADMKYVDEVRAGLRTIRLGRNS